MNMSEEEDCDDLPPITVNSSANNSSTFTMPTAEELAEQRAREQECERQLELLRQRARDDEQLAALRRSDSSGSEGEHALAAAVTALSVRPGAAHEQPAAALWAALAPRLPPPAAALQWHAPAAQLQRAVHAVGAALAAERAAWPDDELLSAGALLCGAALAQESRSRRAAARALHALLDDRATPAQVSLLTGALLAALPEARVRMRMGDVLRSGGGGGADRAAGALAAAALLQLLRAPAQDGEEEEAVSMERVARAASAWRACDADTRYVCVQLAGRLLAATSGATDATSGATDATSGATDATSGATDATSGATDATSGATNTTSGATDATSGATNTTSGATDTTSGATDATSGATNTTSGATDATSGATNTTSGATDATSGATDGTSGATNNTSGATDATSGSTDATSGATDATSGATNTTSGATDATSGATDATSGATDATSGATDATSGATDATSGATDATSGATNTTSGATDTTSGAVDTTRATQEVRARLLAHLSPPPGGASDAHRPDRLKALVGASKLKLLFCAKTGVSGQHGPQRDTST